MTNETGSTALDPASQQGAGDAESRTARILFATDPICSHCWAMEPAWRRFIFLYGAHIEATYLYGGLLPGWEGFNDSAGIQKPTEIPPHWDEVAERYGQPIDTSVWYSDPLASSYPPSVATHAVRAIAPAREDDYLRRIRQAVFLEGRNIARSEVLIECAETIGLDAPKFETAFRSPTSEEAFASDLQTRASRGIRGFPTLILTGPASEQPWVMRGSQPFFRLERALGAVLGEPPKAQEVTVEAVLQQYGSGTTREFSEVLELDEERTFAALQQAGVVGKPVASSHLWRV